MRLTDICSPGFVTNSLPLQQAVVKALSFAENQCPESASEKAEHLKLFFLEAIAKCDTLIIKPEPEVVDVVKAKKSVKGD